MDGAPDPRSVVWVGSSRADLKRFPKQVRRDLGQALDLIRRRLADAQQLHHERQH